MKALDNKDLCPSWADELIHSLYQVEVYLGHIVEDKEWSSQYLKKYQNRAFFSQEEVFDDRKAEYVFKKIVKGLAKENFSAAKICEFINTRIVTKTKMSYCSVDEVAEVL